MMGLELNDYESRPGKHSENPKAKEDVRCRRYPSAADLGRGVVVVRFAITGL